MLIVRLIGFVTLLFAVAATAYCGWNYVGPYAWLADAQLALTGAYEVQLTWLCTFLGFMLPGLVVVLPLRLAMGWNNTQSDPGLNIWIQNNRGSLVLGILSPMMLCVAAYFAFDAWSMGAFTPLHVAQLERGVAPSRYVQVTGVLAPDESLAMEEEHITRTYVPMSSTGRPPFSVFIETTQSGVQTPIEGVLYESGLPGPLRDSFRTQGLLAGTHWTLSPGRSPDSRWMEAGVFAAVGCAALMLLIAIRAWVLVRG